MNVYDRRSKSAFRALRERVGMSRTSLARALEVEVRSIQRWERRDAPQMPPQDAWDVLEDRLAVQRQVVHFALAKAEELARMTGVNEIALPYWLDQEEYMTFSRDAALGVPGDHVMADATLRAAATALELSGFDVRFVDGGTVPPSFGLETEDDPAL